MENSEKKIEALQGTSDSPNQSSTGYDGKLDIERLENSFSAFLLQLKELIHERDELKRMNGDYNQELLSKENRIKQLIVENDKLKDENMALRDRIDDSVLQSNNFDEDSLLEIFSYLSVDDMMQVKRVCKQWHRVSQQRFKQVQTLVCHIDDTANDRLRFYEKYYKRKVYEKIDVCGFFDLMSILHSCGHYIKYFKVHIYQSGRYSNEICKRFISECIPQLCKNIVDFEFTGPEQFPYPGIMNYKFMAKHWEKLERIETQYLPTTVPQNFLKLLRNNNQLKTVNLSFDSDSDDPINDNFFTCLPRTVKEISITDVGINDTEHLSNFILASENFTSLQSLKLSHVRRLNDDVAAAIANITSLTHLCLNHVYRYESRRTIEQIANLKGLKSLYLMYNKGLHEDSFINILESCIHLEALLIYRETILTNREWAAIAKMKKLTCLNIHAKNVSIESIINLCDKLEVLWFCWSKMNNSDVIKLLKKASNLRYISFTFCSNLTKDILQEANEIANKRKNNILVIRAVSDKIDDDEEEAFKDGNPEDIDTPYFKYFKNRKIPLRIFPNNIINYIKDEIVVKK